MDGMVVISITVGFPILKAGELVAVSTATVIPCIMVGDIIDEISKSVA